MGYFLVIVALIGIAIAFPWFWFVILLFVGLLMLENQN